MNNFDFTVEDFKSQHVNWQDRYYAYAIHITTGGAEYLYQASLPLTQDSVDSMHIFRIDGVNLDSLLNSIKTAEYLVSDYVKTCEKLQEELDKECNTT